MHPPTTEQSAILDFVSSSKRNLMIRAYAGCGKTSTLELIDQALAIPKLLICFNKSIADEAKTRMRPSTTVKTFNGLGHSVWSDACGRKLTLDNRKVSTIFKTFVDAASKGERNELWKHYDLISSAVNLARAIGYIPATHAKAHKALCDWPTLARSLDEVPSRELHSFIDKILNESIRQAYLGVIDFNDQIYMPALFAGIFPEFPLLMIDEYQDLSPVNQAMVAKLSKRARQIGVGDEAQAIYGFRGADEDSMPSAISRFDMSVLPLSLTFRCPERIVENVHWRVPKFRAHHSGGTITSFPFRWPEASEFHPSAAVISRYNAPILKTAMRFLLDGHRIDVTGIDIGAKLLKTLERLGPETLSRKETIAAIDDWETEKLANESKSASDFADSMRVFAHQATSLSGAILYARNLFAQASGTYRFMSGHKAKGLEFDHVYHLDRHKIERKRDQDANIEYVIDTRPKVSLTYINSDTIGGEYDPKKKVLEASHCP